MSANQQKQPAIWDDESGEPCPMTAEEFDARLEVSNRRQQQEIEAAKARNRELAELVAQKEALAERLQAAVDEARRESARINARAAALRAASRRAQRKGDDAHLPSHPTAASQ